jgi:hypothetical protein
LLEWDDEGSREMFENMAGAVGFAMHEDRLAQAAQNLRLAEAKEGARAGVSGGYRAALATALKALAARIAPPATRPGGGYAQAVGR